MPLLDPFHPPLSRQRHWDSFHSGWAEAIAVHLNQGLLPPRYVAEAQVTVGPRVEIDVGTFEGQNGASGGQSEVAVWAPPRPVAVTPVKFTRSDLFEVQIINDEEGPRVVAAIELVSPANKDQSANRQIFAIKCASYLQQGVNVMVVDVVTERSGNLHRELLQLLDLTVETPCQAPGDLYATAYRAVPRGENLDLEMWVEALALAARLPTLPLWIGPDLSVPLDLEQTYAAACAARRIDG
jgi:hypothetical protein